MPSAAWPAAVRPAAMSPEARRGRRCGAALASAVSFGMAVLAGCSTGSDRPTPSSQQAGSAARSSPAAKADATSAPSSTTGGQSPAPDATMTLAFGGDVHFEGVDRARLSADPATAMGPIAALLRRADLAMVNLETAITTRGTPAAKRYVFRAPRRPSLRFARRGSTW